MPYLILSFQFQEQFNSASVSLMLHEGEPFQGVYEIIPAVFTITSDVEPLSFDLVTSTILNNYNNHMSFEEFSETEEPPGLAAMTPTSVFVFLYLQNSICIVVYNIMCVIR